MKPWLALLALLALTGCPDDDDDATSGPDDDDTTSAPDDDDATLGIEPVTVAVTLDGGPVEGASVGQGGAGERWLTDADGEATIDFDFGVETKWIVVASVGEARIGGIAVPHPPSAEPVAVALTSYDDADNPDYAFRPPGTPPDVGTTEFCNHCHRTMTEDWFASPHRASASNPAVHDVYAGAAASIPDAGACADAGGVWAEGLEPGTGTAAERCYLGDGVLPALNDGCGGADPCDAVATRFGGCADCHAPGIDGQLGGRSLLEATGEAYDKGVHCDVCHHVESIDPAAEPGVAGRLRILRPSEAGSPGLGEFQPIMFGPWDDVLSPIMGAVQRTFFEEAIFCSGCHQQDQAVLLPGEVLDEGRWPSGRLPIHSTYQEWSEGPLGAGGSTCQDCHMPLDPEVANGADLQLFPELTPGIAGGWERDEVHGHSFVGPRDADAGLLGLVALVTVDAVVEGDEVIASVAVRNGNRGHFVPTGEPMRHLMLRVEARCDDVLLSPTGGHAVPDFGGALATQDATGDWSVWPGAQVGQVVRVVRRTSAFHDYPGFGPFGDGTFDAPAKGMPVDEPAGFSTITAVDGDTVTFDLPLPAGEVAYLGEAAALPQDGATAAAVAGAPGFGFARVLVGADGARMVPHFAATDVASDNRLEPDGEWTSEHRFAADCEAPVVDAVLSWRQYPLGLARERGWALTDVLMRSATGTAR